MLRSHNRPARLHPTNRRHRRLHQPPSSHTLRLPLTQVRPFLPLSSNPNPNPNPSRREEYDDDEVKTLARVESPHNSIRVLEVSRRADHPLAGSRLLLLDGPGNIHSISSPSKLFTASYYDVFATLPPVVPPGPLALLGFGAGTAARLLLSLFPFSSIHGWEIDPAVLSFSRQLLHLSDLESQFPNRLSLHLGDALLLPPSPLFSGILVDLFSKGSLLPQLQDPSTWVAFKERLLPGGRIMVNCGGGCVESEDSLRDGKVVMEMTLVAMAEVFSPGELFVLDMGLGRREDCSLALTGPLPDLDSWRLSLPSPLKGYVDRWTPFPSVRRE